MVKLETIHPFPARMAPELAYQELLKLQRVSNFVDPFCGSGTVPRIISQYKHNVFGFDIDPLAILMTRVWTTKVDLELVKKRSEKIIEGISAKKHVFLPWIDNDPETKSFIDFWFVEPQQSLLRSLSFLLLEIDDEVQQVLKLALSRIIITKKKGASLGGDISHSRPHRIRQTNDFDVILEFKKSVNILCKKLSIVNIKGNVKIEFGDARKINLDDNVANAVVTSPPYLNAIDYLRGHRLSLVWLGYKIAYLRNIRSNSIGSEKKSVLAADLLDLRENIGNIASLDFKQQGFIDRYLEDLYYSSQEINRILITGGKAIFVIGNSCLKGTFIKNDQALINACQKSGLKLISKKSRELPPNKRYLPPPIATNVGPQRMREESILTFIK